MAVRIHISNQTQGMSSLSVDWQDKIPVSPSVGDVVLVSDQDLQRGQWKLAIVEETLAGRGHIRGVIVRVHSKGGQRT